MRKIVSSSGPLGSPPHAAGVFVNYYSCVLGIIHANILTVLSSETLSQLRNA